MPDRPRLPVTIVEVSCSLRILPEISIRSQHRIKAGTDLESLLGQADGRLEQSSPGQFPVLLVYLLVERVNFGQVIASGTPREVQGNDAVIAAYLGSGDVGAIARRIKAEAA